MNGEFKKGVVTWRVISLFLHLPGTPGVCADFGDSTDLSRFIATEQTLARKIAHNHALDDVP